MRLIQLRVPVEDRDAVLGALDEEGVDYVDTPETDGGATLVHFPLPTAGVETVLGAVRDAGLEGGDYLVVASAETARSPGFEDLEERFIESEEEDDGIAAAELRSKTLHLTPGRLVYYAMTLLSVLVAVAGLLLDAPSVVVGAMVVSPQVGASLTAAVGAVLGDRSMVRNGLRMQALALGGSVLAAAAFGWALRSTEFIPPVLDITTVGQISARTSPGLLTILVGLAAGAAGGFSLSSDVPESLVGVAVAVALVPAAAAAGIGLAWGYLTVAVGAGILLLVNAVSINVAAVAVLWYLGYRPWEDGAGALADLRRAARSRAALALAAATLVVIAGPGALVAGHVAYENAANDAVEDTLRGYDSLQLLATHVEFTAGTGVTPELVVEVSRPDDRAYPALADRLERAVERRTGRRTVVQVEYVDRSDSS